ncbi:MAG: sugar ABC transporter ATP-binding protein [Pseudomonadota bacterium]
MTQAPLLELAGVTMRFGATTALDNVDFACHGAEIHAVLGENGAGKSTLMKLMAGVLQPTQGAVRLDGAQVNLATPAEAVARGIVCVFQELSLVPDLTVRDNLMLGAPGSGLLRLDRSVLGAARDMLDRCGAHQIRLSSRVVDLSLAERQIIEVVKGLIRKPRLLILDEATSALNTTVVEKVFDLVRVARDSGTGVLFISHRFHEIEALADRVSVFRNGQNVRSFANGTHSYSEIIDMMVGQRIDDLFPAKPTTDAGAEEVLAITRLSTEGGLSDVTMTLKKGQILGLGGLDGQGQSALLQSLFGLIRGQKGGIAIGGEPVQIRNPKSAKSPEIALAYIPEDRKTEGLIQDQSIAENLELPALGILPAGARAEGLFRPSLDALELKHGGLDKPVASLSGGNQQKIVLSKWLALKPRVLLLADPTRGIDVKTKTQIYQLLRQLADQGTAILLLSTDYEELIHLCDEAHIFYDGRVVSRLQGEDITAHNIVAASMNLPMNEANHA